MRLSPLLLRFLLIVALVSNAMGSAFAAAQMQIDHWHGASAMAHREPVAERSAIPCGEHSGMAAHAAESKSDRIADLGRTDPGKTDHGSPDCCQSAKCQCACMQYAAIATVGMHVLEANAYRAINAGALNTGHDAPALPHLIRPPIG